MAERGVTQGAIPWADGPQFAYARPSMGENNWHGSLLNANQDAAGTSCVAVQGAEGERLEHEHVQRALQEVGAATVRRSRSQIVHSQTVCIYSILE
jgi:hypothetical protein